MLIFLPAALVGYFALAGRGLRKPALAFLVFASLFFYGYWDTRCAPLLILSVLFNYAVGFYLADNRSKALCAAGVAANIGLLCYFKYTFFFMDAAASALNLPYAAPQIILPIGISFYTFTQMAYIVDCYRGETRKRDLLSYSLFVTIFPHLVAGPILYHKDIIPQFSKPENFSVRYKNLSSGMALFAMGLMKKTLADSLSPLVNHVFSNPAAATLLDSWAGALAYTIQLYLDFSGYSEMAVGLGLMFNFNLPVNFNSPYKAKSIIEFWQRWHITLSAFLKSYLYIPLGGNRRGQLMKMRNLFITMLLCWMWHGAGWTFIVWGAYHGVLLVANHQWRRLGVRVPGAFAWVATFIAVVVGWVIFRADSLQSAAELLKAMSGANGVAMPLSLARFAPLLSWTGADFTTGLGVALFKYELVALPLFLLAVFFFPNPMQIMKKFRPTPAWAFGLAGVVFFCLLKLSNVTEFLYFQF